MHCSIVYLRTAVAVASGTTVKREEPTLRRVDRTAKDTVPHRTTQHGGAASRQHSTDEEPPPCCSRCQGTVASARPRHFTRCRTRWSQHESRGNLAEEPLLHDFEDERAPDVKMRTSLGCKDSKTVRVWIPGCAASVDRPEIQLGMERLQPSNAEV